MGKIRDEGTFASSINVDGLVVELVMGVCEVVESVGVRDVVGADDVVTSTADAFRVPPPHVQQAWVAVIPPSPTLVAAFGTKQRALVSKNEQSADEPGKRRHERPFAIKSRHGTVEVVVVVV